MINYNLSVRGNLAVAAFFLALVPSAARSFQIVEIDIKGQGNASAANEAGLYLITAAGTGSPTAAPTGPVTNESPNMTGTTPALAFSGTAITAYGTTAPTFATLKLNLPFNSNGDRYWWKCNTNKNNAFVVPGGSLGMALAGISGTGAFSCRISVDEF